MHDAPGALRLHSTVPRNSTVAHKFQTPHQHSLVRYKAGRCSLPADAGRCCCAAGRGRRGTTSTFGEWDAAPRLAGAAGDCCGVDTSPARCRCSASASAMPCACREVPAGMRTDALWWGKAIRMESGGRQDAQAVARGPQKGCVGAACTSAAPAAATMGYWRAHHFAQLPFGARPCLGKHWAEQREGQRRPQRSWAAV